MENNETNNEKRNSETQEGADRRPNEKKRWQRPRGKKPEGGELVAGESKVTTQKAPKPRGKRPSGMVDPMAGGIDENGIGWFGKMKDALAANKEADFDRLNRFIGKGNKDKSIRFVPLGGLDQIGGNIAVIESENSAFVIDVGMSFPSPDMHGVDVLVPDFSYLHAIKDKLVGIVITHAHEDHIGAVPYLLKEIKVPIYGTPLPLAMIASKLDEHKLTKEKSLFRFVEKRKPVKIGDFEVEWMHMTHSVIDASALAITHEAGTLIHTGDFKLDNTPYDGLPTDYHRLAHYGERGVLALFSDSTNSYNPGMTKSEAVVGKSFDALFSKTKGRIILSTFSSNVHRVAQAIAVGAKYGRKVAVIGRSMEKNLNLAMELGYINFDSKIFVDAHEANRMPDNQVLIVTTGSQGETQSALYRMATDEHRHIKIKPSDTIILSARAIPGNEASISTVVNLLAKGGASVSYQELGDMHVSGHAAQEEQKMILRLVKPKHFIPVHGEYQHLLRHKETAVSCGISERDVALIEDGEQIEISYRGIRKVRSIKYGKTFIDNQANREVDSQVVYDRQHLASDGLVMIVAVVDKATQKIVGRAKINSFGLVSHKKENMFAREVEDTLINIIAATKPEELAGGKAVENALRAALKRQIFKAHKRYPAIIPTIIVQ